jgi:hypothetical protein
MSECHVQAVGEKGDENMRLDPMLALVEDRPDRQIPFEGFESLLDRDQVQVLLPITYLSLRTF